VPCLKTLTLTFNPQPYSEPRGRLVTLLPCVLQPPHADVTFRRAGSCVKMRPCGRLENTVALHRAHAAVAMNVTAAL
jgi:hypothetical protein